MDTQNPHNANPGTDKQNTQNSQSGQGGNNRGKNKMPRFNFSWIYVIIAIALGYLFFAGGDSEQNGVSKTHRVRPFLSGKTGGSERSRQFL